MILEHRTNFGIVAARIYKPYTSKTDVSGFKPDLEIVVQEHTNLVEYGIGSLKRGPQVFGKVAQYLAFTAIEH